MDGMVMRKRLPTGLLGMLVVVLFTESYIDRHEAKFTTVWASSWQSADRAARTRAAGCDVLGFGDSLVKHGFVPEVVERRTGRAAYNLAVFNGNGPSNYLLLKRALDAGARPSSVVVDGELLEEDPRQHERRWSDLATFGEIAEIARAARDARFLAAVAVGRIVPSIKARHEVREDIMAALRGELPSGVWDLPAQWRNWRRNDGAHLVTPVARTESAAAMLERTGFLPKTWTCHPLNAGYVRKFMKLAQSRGIAVYWLWPPVHPEVQARRERGGRDAIFARFLARLQADFPNVTVVDARRAGYPESSMHDMTHLNRDGAVAFSAQVAEVLRARETGPRWVELPADRPVPKDVVAEDLDQSRVAVRELSNARRR